MLLHPQQSKIASDRHRFRVVNCGRRFGKTILAVEEMIGVAIAGKDRRVVYYAPTRDDARDIVWGHLLKRCEPIITYKNDSRLEIKVKTQDGGESLITLYGWESVQERGKGRGLSNNFIVADEVAQYRNFWVGWDEVLSPTLIDTKGSALFISTPKGFNHFYDLYNKEVKDKDYASFHFTSYDNPHLPQDELERERKSKTEDRFAQEYMADFRKTEGLVYKEFERSRHLIHGELKDHMKGYNKIFAGVDFGFTNPCAVLTIYKDNDSKYFVEKEYYQRGNTDAQIADYVMSQSYNVVYPDPESASGIEELKRKGVNIREVIKNKDSIRNGINQVRELFKSNRLFIHDSCYNLVSELETYSYPDKRPDHNEEENPIKENDHALDALRYAIMMEETKPMFTGTPMASPSVLPYYPDLGI